MMTWTCDNPRCDRVMKGFRNGRTLCHVCRRVRKRQEEKKTWNGKPNA